MPWDGDGLLGGMRTLLVVHLVQQIRSGLHFLFLHCMQLHRCNCAMKSTVEASFLG